MKQGDEYLQHIKECWEYAQQAADNMINQEQKIVRLNLMLSIFEKCCSPYHYFLEREEYEPSSLQPPTEKQIAYAKQLGILDPETMSRQQLSEKIDEALRQKEK